MYFSRVSPLWLTASQLILTSPFSSTFRRHLFVALHGEGNGSLAPGPIAGRKDLASTGHSGPRTGFVSKWFQVVVATKLAVSAMNNQHEYAGAVIGAGINANVIADTVNFVATTT